MIDGEFDGVTLYVKLHTADPGSAGTTAPAGETDRAAVTFAAASGGAATNDVDADWTSVSTGETYTHVSIWDHVSAGNFKGSGALTTPRVMQAGDDFTLPAGELDLALT